MTGAAFAEDDDGARSRRPSLRVRVLAGIAVPAAVTLLAFTEVSTANAALVYMLAIACASAFGGIAAGLVAAVASFIPFDYFFTRPHGSFGFGNSEDAVAAVLFVVVGVGMGVLIERERRVRATADARGSEARRAQKAAEDARAEAMRAARTAERLQHAAEALSVAVSPEQVLDAVLTQTVAAADAQAGLIALVSDDGTELEVVAARGYRDDLIRRWRTFPVDAAYPLSEAVRTVTPVFLRSERERIERFPALPSTGEPTHALVCLPLTVEDRTIGGLTFSFPEEQEFDEQRRELKLALARQAAQALDRSRLYGAVEAAEARISYLAEVGELLSTSLDYEETLRRVVALAVPRLADWCTVDVLEARGRIRLVAVGHVDTAKVEWARSLRDRFPPDPDAPYGMARVLRTGEPEFLHEVPRELLAEAAARQPGIREALDELGLRSWICVPVGSPGGLVGALSLVSTSRLFTQADFDLAVAVAERASVAIENARLYREAGRRANAARALGYVGDAVVLVDHDGVVRYWNDAAEIVLGPGAAEADGHPMSELVPWWAALTAQLAPAGAAVGELPPSTTVPVTIGGEERWLSGAAVDFGDGCVYTLRDVTNERVLEQARSDFVATASHELRTPLAAVYGAVRTLRRRDVDIGDENRDLFLEIIENETERLNLIVAQILTAGQLGSDGLRLDSVSCDLRDLAAGVLAAARVRSPESITLELRAPEELPPVRCDDEKLRQVLVNLVENAIKYSPDGGEVAVELSATDSHVRLDVLDQGLGIPSSDHERVFEKFTRLDPGLTRGVGGTGLGLYIARELTERMGGRITVASSAGAGSTFTLLFPAERALPVSS